MRTFNLAAPAVSVALPYAPAPFLYYRGFSVRETAGVAASFVVYDGTSATGTILDEVTLIANESAREDYGYPVVAKIGIYVQITAGSLTGSIRFD